MSFPIISSCKSKSGSGSGSDPGPGSFFLVTSGTELKFPIYANIS